jgi:hypothetical protein
MGKHDIRSRSVQHLNSITHNKKKKNRSVALLTQWCTLSTHRTNKSWRDEFNGGPSVPKVKANHLIIMNSSIEMVVIPNFLLIWKTGSKQGKYRDQMNPGNYMKDKLVPSLIQWLLSSVGHVIRTPTASTGNGILKNRLQARGITFSLYMQKPRVYGLIEIHRLRYEPCSLDESLQFHDHQEVLRLPL